MREKTANLGKTFLRHFQPWLTNMKAIFQEIRLGFGKVESNTKSKREIVSKILHVKLHLNYTYTL